jgi:hypothetical protein
MPHAAFPASSPPLPQTWQTRLLTYRTDINNYDYDNHSLLLPSFHALLIKYYLRLVAGEAARLVHHA